MMQPIVRRVVVYAKLRDLHNPDPASGQCSDSQDLMISTL